MGSGGFPRERRWARGSPRRPKESAPPSSAGTTKVATAGERGDSGLREGRERRKVGSNGGGPGGGRGLVGVTAGIARKPGMSRDDLVRSNADIVKQVSQQIKQTCPKAIVLVVSNPLDVMCWVTKQVTGFPRERVIGMAGVLDTARYRAFLAEALDVSVDAIQAL